MIPQWWRNVIHSPLCSTLEDETVAWPHISYKAVTAYPWINEFVNYTSYTLCISGKKSERLQVSIYQYERNKTLTLHCFCHSNVLHTTLSLNLSAYTIVTWLQGKTWQALTNISIICDEQHTNIQNGQSTGMSLPQTFLTRDRAQLPCIKKIREEPEVCLIYITPITGKISVRWWL